MLRSVLPSRGFVWLALFMLSALVVGAGCVPATTAPPAGPDQGGAADPMPSDVEPSPGRVLAGPELPGHEVTASPEPPARASAGPSGQLAGVLEAHNRYRQKHCAPPLTWSEELARVAQDWADQLNKRGCAFEHRPDDRYGENLAFYAPASSADPDRVVAGWYDEVAKYDFKKAEFGFDTGHFTQVVWVRTTELGCGVTTCKNGAIWVCNYSPPGNFRRQFKANVLPTSCSRR
jgi:pathogenesis-related protein 1